MISISLGVALVVCGYATYNLRGVRGKWWVNIQSDAGTRAKPIAEWVARATAPDDVVISDLKMPDHDGIEVPRGSRVRLIFDRQEDNPCSEEVVVPDFGIRRDLPALSLDRSHRRPARRCAEERAGDRLRHCRRRGSGGFGTCSADCSWPG